MLTDNNGTKPKHEKISIKIDSFLFVSFVIVSNNELLVVSIIVGLFSQMNTIMFFHTGINKIINNITKDNFINDFLLIPTLLFKLSL